MVSARPPPNPARGRVAYPTAANYTSGDGDTPAYLNSEPIHPTSSRDSDKERAQGLKTWWKAFSGKDEPGGSGAAASGSRAGGGGGQYGGVFGVPLQQSINYASVQISTTADDGALYVWGVVPVVVAKCGLFLKETATEVEGTFRISGSAKRMRELQAIFDTGPKYGKNIDWKKLSYTEHDVATIFRRFLTQMPEPIIPFDMYENFREALDPEVPAEELVPRYKELVHALPDINQYLLLYVLDLLHVFAKNSDKNLMTAANLALIFQPGMLSHPVHAMRPRDHVLSQQVLEFLIEHQDHFLVGMQLKKKKRQTSSSSPPEPTSPPPPVMTKADADLMLPSDSDDDAPEGGYYVVESSGPQRPLSPQATQQPLSPRQTPQTSFGAAATRVRSHSLTGQTGASASQIQTQPTIREREELQPSDSDDEAPPGGYEVHQSDFAKNRAAILERNRNRPRTNSDVKATQSVIPAAPGAAGGTGASSAGASGLSRRKTVPARLLGGGKRAPNVRRNSREAP